jgi:hypothetical protein
VPAHIASSAGLDKEQVWADNAASSPFFGNVYVCYSDFHSFSHGHNFALFPSVAVSTDGGQTWKAHHVAPPTTTTRQGFHQGCTFRTDSHGVAHAFFTHFSETSNVGTQTMVKSFTGGATWGRPTDFMQMNDGCFFVDPVEGRCTMEGPAGARTDLMYVSYNSFTTPFSNTTATPRLDHGVLRSAALGANGAPTGWTTQFVGASGDARGTSQGRILYNEFLGDYVYAVATRTYGAGVWTDVPDTADCPAMDAWRQASFNAGQLVFPAPWPLADCPAN